MFPDSEYLDALLSEFLVVKPVAPLVSLDLRLPVGVICLRDVTAPGATVPETSVHEYGDAFSGK